MTFPPAHAGGAAASYRYQFHPPMKGQPPMMEEQAESLSRKTAPTALGA